MSARRKPKWCGAPGIVFGRRNTYYLDTMRYHCNTCSKWFKGTNQQSLEHATIDIIASFPFYLGSRYAVDMELKHYIVQHFPHMSLAKMTKELKTSYYITYHEAISMYVSNRVFAHRHGFREKRSDQLVMDDFVGS